MICIESKAGMDIGRDHRCLWLDIRTRVLMGKDLEQSRKFTAQRLKCDDPRLRNKYIKHNTLKHTEILPHRTDTHSIPPVIRQKENTSKLEAHKLPRLTDGPTVGTNLGKILREREGGLGSHY
jgi:hypothetical protein